MGVALRNADVKKAKAACLAVAKQNREATEELRAGNADAGPVVKKAIDAQIAALEAEATELEAIATYIDDKLAAKPAKATETTAS
jgi:hypothetical protein